MKPSQLLNRKSRWTQGAYARDKNGHPVYPRSTQAIRWCAEGLLYRCVPDSKRMRAFNLIQKITIRPLSIWNDDPKRKWTEVRDLLRKAVM